MMAFKVGVLAHFIGGIVFIIGAFVVPMILKIVPAGALFGSLGGRRHGVSDSPVYGWHLENAAGWLAVLDCPVRHLSGQGQHQTSCRT